ncbi:MAG: DUF881 domain-containing protein [Clostridium sp.]
MKKRSQYFFVFIAALILGFLVSVNFNFDRGQSYNSLNTMEYQEAIEERSRLYKEIEALKEGNIDVNGKINQYKQNDVRNDEILQDMKEQIMDYGMFTGLTEVEGPGIILTLNDGITDVNGEGFDEVMSKLLHDSDMALVLNELRQAGAEAISVNNHRIVPWSGVVCAWAFIQFDDSSMESAPFKIYAIGDPEKLEAALLEDGSHVKKLIIKKFFVEIEKSEKIKMPASTAKGNVNYMERDELAK